MDACPSSRPRRFSAQAHRRRLPIAGVMTIAAVLCAVAWPSRLPATEPRDPLAQAVIDSLQSEPRTTPEELLEATILASDVDAYELASSFLAEFVEVMAAMGDERDARLADLAELDPVGLVRTKRRLGARDAEAVTVLNAIQQASLRRYQDPAWLAGIAASLSDPSSAARSRAFDQLSRAGVQAIPAAVEILNQPEPTDEPGRLGRALAWRLIHELGTSAREPLLTWLGSGDIDRWPGVLRGLSACGSRKEADYLLAPMLVVDSPAEVVEAATDAYRQLTGGTAARLPSRTQAVGRLTDRLERLLRPTALLPDGIVLDGAGSPDLTADDPLAIASLPPAERGGDPDLRVTATLFDGQTNAIVQSRLSRRFLRGLQAAHFSRDLMALATDNPLALRLAILAQLEMVTLSHSPSDPQGLAAIRTFLEGPGGFDSQQIASVIDEAAARGLHNAAAAAIRGVVDQYADQPAAALPKPLREAILGLLASPDLELRYQAADALVRLTEGSFADVSRVVETLAFCADSSGADRVVIAHPQRAVAVDLESYLAQYGFRAELVGRGVGVVPAANHCDTRLVMLSARLGDPDALEVAQLIRTIPADEPIAVLIAIDPGDDAGAAAFRQQLQQRLTGFEGQGLYWVTLTDRLPSLFEAEISPDTGEPLADARLGSMLARIDRESLLMGSRRSKLAANRLARGQQAIHHLATLAERGVDVEAAVPTVVRLLARRQHAAACIAMLAATDTKAAQRALAETACRPVEADGLRRAAAAGLDASIDAFGILLDDATVAGFLRRYNGATDPVRRAVLEVLASIDPIVAASAGDAESGSAAPQRR